MQWGTAPPRVGDGSETQEGGPPPLFKSEQPFQKADTAANLEAKPNLDRHGLVQSMTQLSPTGPCTVIYMRLELAGPYLN